MKDFYWLIPETGQKWRRPFRELAEELMILFQDLCDQKTEPSIDMEIGYQKLLFLFDDSNKIYGAATIRFMWFRDAQDMPPIDRTQTTYRRIGKGAISDYGWVFTGKGKQCSGCVCFVYDTKSGSTAPTDGKVLAFRTREMA